MSACPRRPKRDINTEHEDAFVLGAQTQTHQVQNSTIFVFHWYFHLKTMQEEKTVIVELGKSQIQNCSLIQPKVIFLILEILDLYVILYMYSHVSLLSSIYPFSAMHLLLVMTKSVVNYLPKCTYQLHYISALLTFDWCLYKVLIDIIDFSFTFTS